MVLGDNEVPSPDPKKSRVTLFFELEFQLEYLNVRH